MYVFCQEVKSHEASSQPTVQNAGSCTFPTPFNLACVRGIMVYYQNAKYVYLEESKWWSSSSFLLLLIFYSDRMGKKVSWFIFTQEKKKNPSKLEIITMAYHIMWIGWKSRKLFHMPLSLLLKCKWPQFAKYIFSRNIRYSTWVTLQEAFGLADMYVHYIDLEFVSVFWVS